MSFLNLGLQKLFLTIQIHAHLNIGIIKLLANMYVLNKTLSDSWYLYRWFLFIFYVAINPCCVNKEIIIINNY